MCMGLMNVYIANTDACNRRIVIVDMAICDMPNMQCC